MLICIIFIFLVLGFYYLKAPTLQNKRYILDKFKMFDGLRANTLKASPLAGLNITNPTHLFFFERVRVDPLGITLFTGLLGIFTNLVGIVAKFFFFFFWGPIVAKLNVCKYYLKIAAIFNISLQEYKYCSNIKFLMLLFDAFCALQGIVTRLL